MAFNVTYGQLISHNINHLYTTRQKTMYKNSPRQKLYNPEFRKLEMQAEERHQRRRRTRRTPNMEFIPEYDISMPRAPAFRTANTEYIDELVQRLSKRSKLKSDPRSCPRYHTDFYEYDYEEDLDSPRTQMSKKEIRHVVSRLNKRSECCKRHPSPNIREEDYLPNITI